ncbi:MAG: hypothetical protein HND54_09855 [Bacteroidetes bacterium]|nr:hypothetical protein [Bacteroidota bacterium]
MRNSIILILTFMAQLGLAQNIIQLRIVPVNPTVADSVMLIADLQFSSSACLLDSKSHSVNGNSIVASTHYCIGIAAAICNTIDTFHLGKLNPGNYNVCALNGKYK